MPLASLDDAFRREEIRTRLGSFHPQVVRRWGVLTPGGAMCHLSLAFEMVPRNLKRSTRTGSLRGMILRCFGLYAPMRWPHGIPTLPELVEGAPGVCPQDFDHDRSRLLMAYEHFAASTAVDGFAHPIFGPLTHWEWMRWGYLHADHHLRQFDL